jgi:hypothetical protein
MRQTTQNAPSATTARNNPGRLWRCAHPLTASASIAELQVASTIQQISRPKNRTNDISAMVPDGPRALRTAAQETDRDCREVIAPVHAPLTADPCGMTPSGYGTMHYARRRRWSPQGWISQPSAMITGLPMSM